MMKAFLICCSIFLVSSSCSKSSSSGFKGYTFTNGTATITYSLMGVASDGTARAGADPTSLITSDNRVRLIFTGASAMKSALSTDGITFTVDSGFTSPFPLVGIAEQMIVANPSGGYRMFARSDTLVYSATSTDGATWTQESGTRFDASSVGLTTITGPTVVRLSDGRYRMYFSPEITNCATAGTSSKIYSATSADQLTWTADSGVRIDDSFESRCKNKPSAIVEPDGSITLFYHVYSLTGSGDTYSGMTYYSNSTDGLTFTSQTSTGVGNTSSTSGGLTQSSDPNILQMPDGTLRLYYDVLKSPEGDQIYVATGTRN